MVGCLLRWSLISNFDVIYNIMCSFVQEFFCFFFFFLWYQVYKSLVWTPNILSNQVNLVRMVYSQNFFFFFWQLYLTLGVDMFCTLTLVNVLRCIICKQTLIWFQFSSVKENNHISRLNYLWKSTIFFNSSYEEQCLSHVKEGKGEEVEHGGTKVKG